MTEAEYCRRFFKQPLNILKNYTYTGLMFCMLFESMLVKRTSLKWLHLENVLALYSYQDTKFICAYQVKITGMFTYAAQSFDHEAVIFK